MLDNPEKTARLLAALKAAVPFDVELSERLEKVGWNRYFEQVNYVGKTITAEEYSESLLGGLEVGHADGGGRSTACARGQRAGKQ